MEETVPKPTLGFLIAAGAVALLIGAFVGVLVGFLTHHILLGVISGVVVAALAGLASVLEARRAGRRTREGAPPWSGDAAARHHNGGSA